MLTLTASGSVSDYTDSDKSSLQQKVANAAGVDASFVTISVAAASVRITATIGVPASMTADAVRASLSSTLGTAADASEALGITVEEAPTVALVDDPSQPPKDMSATYAAVAASVNDLIKFSRIYVEQELKDELGDAVLQPHMSCDSLYAWNGARGAGIVFDAKSEPLLRRAFVVALERCGSAGQ